MPFIVIEGCDGTGKSTLAEKVESYALQMTDFKVRRLHYGVPPKDPASVLTLGEQAMNALLEPLQDFDVNEDFVIVDRFHWGEPVYAPVFRADDCVDPLFGTLTHREFYYVENWLQMIGAINVYCTAPDEVIFQRVVHDRDEADLVRDSGAAEERIRQIKDRYVKLGGYISSPNRKSPTKIYHQELLKPEDTHDAAINMVILAQDAWNTVMDNIPGGSTMTLPLITERTMVDQIVTEGVITDADNG